MFTFKKTLIATAVAATATALAFGSWSAAVASPQSASLHASTPLGPTVTHTGKAPTGYSVTFRIKAPTATSMLIKGTWSFSNEAASSTDPTNANAISAADWSAGDFPLQDPDQPGEGWPVNAMTEDARTGIWSFTTPLPSGTFDYQFFADCTSATATACTATTDPANVAWNATSGTVKGDPAVFSQVYVPSDERFGTEDKSWLAPAAKKNRGALSSVSYATSSTTSGSNNLVVYTPAGYDPKRSTPYPLFVLVHGGGENSIAWSSRGQVQNIVDNLVAQGKMQPAVIVMPSDSATADVENDLLPYVEKNYHVSTAAADRAYAGTSAFGGTANDFLFNHTTDFGYYGPWSPAKNAPAVTVTGQGNTPYDAAYDNPALKQLLGIEVAIGQQDTGGNAPQLTAVTEREGLINAKVPFKWFTEGGGHTWTFWQDTLHDFLTTVAFRTTTTTVATTGSRTTATVAAASTEPATPTGTVQFSVNGVKAGAPVRLMHGTATAKRLPAGTVTAAYSGDASYNASTTE